MLRGTPPPWLRKVFGTPAGSTAKPAFAEEDV
jgi:hypothetical protein